MNITYQSKIIAITVKKKEDEHSFHQEREAMIALVDGLPSGLAYLRHASEEGEVSYSVTHVPTGVNSCSCWLAETEEEVQAWIAALLELADWTGPIPRATAPTLTLLRYAIVGRIYELVEKGQLPKSPEGDGLAPS